MVIIVKVGIFSSKYQVLSTGVPTLWVLCEYCILYITNNVETHLEPAYSMSGYDNHNGENIILQEGQE